MKNFFFIVTCIILFMAFVVKQDDKTFKKLYSLEGTWVMKSKKGNIIGEEWVKVNNDYLQNRGFFLKGNDTIVTERVALRKTNNEINYISTVENQNNRQPVAFKLTAADDNKFVFENSQHDFPKRIVYEILSADSLHAWIDGGKSGSSEREDFYYHKVK